MSQFLWSCGLESPRWAKAQEGEEAGGPGRIPGLGCPGAAVLGPEGANGPKTPELFSEELGKLLGERMGPAPRVGRTPPERTRKTKGCLGAPPCPILNQIYPRDPMLIRLCPEVPPSHPAAWSPSATLPTSNDHDHDWMSYGRCRWEDGMKRMERGKELKP